MIRPAGLVTRMPSMALVRTFSIYSRVLIKSFTRYLAHFRSELNTGFPQQLVFDVLHDLGQGEVSGFRKLDIEYEIKISGHRSSGNFRSSLCCSMEMTLLAGNKRVLMSAMEMLLLTS